MRCRPSLLSCRNSTSLCTGRALPAPFRNRFGLRKNGGAQILPRNHVFRGLVESFQARLARGDESQWTSEVGFTFGPSSGKECIESRLYLFRTVLANNLRTNPDQTSSSLSARMPSCHRKIVSCMERSRRSGIGERNNPRSSAHRKFQASHEIVDAISPRRKAAINCAISCSSTKSSK
jgi:hypothetical protein